MVNAFSLTVAHFGWSVDEDTVVKFTEAQVPYTLNDCNGLMCLNGFNIPTHIWLWLVVHPVWLMVFGVSIPKHDAHIIIIYTLNKNSVPIMCLALRHSAIKATFTHYPDTPSTLP